MIKRAGDLGYDVFGAGIRVLRVRGNASQRARKELPEPQELDAGNFGYSILRSTVNSDFYRDLIDMTETMDMPIEGLHTETGPGVLEAALAVDEALAMADKAMLFKCFTKALAQRNGLMATFMAKWSHNEARPERPHPHVAARAGIREVGVPR